MEKFTVDLDKVLDEFEYNEEQAVRHSLHHFKHEDLPATKYQKPHFKPINIADADFAPCIETTMSYQTYHSKNSLEPISLLVDSEKTSNKHNLPSLRGSLTANTYNVDEGDLYQSENFLEKVAVKTVAPSIDEKKLDQNWVENAVSEKQIVGNLKLSETCHDEETNSKDIKKNGVNIDVSDFSREEVESQNFPESQDNKPDLIENKLIYSNTVEEVKGATKLPDLTEVNLEKPKVETDMVESLDLIRNDKEFNETKEQPEKTIDLGEPQPSFTIEPELESQTTPDFQPEVEDHHVSVSQPQSVEKLKTEGIKATQMQEPEAPSAQTSQSQPEQTSNESQSQINLSKVLMADSQSFTQSSQLSHPQMINDDQLSNEELHVHSSDESESIASAPEGDPALEKREPVSEFPIVATDVKPIQFECQIDITDEELQKCLEELEEEEENEELKAMNSESKPIRPQSLCLGSSGESHHGSVGVMPLPKSTEETEALESEEEVLRNENKEETTTGSENDTETVEDLESFLESTEASRSSSPPLTIDERRLGKVSPFWMPDHLASSCMECDAKFTVIKRRHHCRACGRILCSRCCGMRASLEYLQNQEQRVCETCFRTLAKVLMYELQNEGDVDSSPKRRPNPNNPMEYCSTVPPPLQISNSGSQAPPSVMVPVGVLKREGSSKVKETPKQVMFSDGIRPGGDLTELDGSEDHRNVFRKPGRTTKRIGTPPGSSSLSPSAMLPPIDPVSQSFILDKGLPPIFMVNKGEATYEENWSLSKILEKLKDPNLPPLQFAINRNLVASIKIVKLDCCMKETCWVICSKGMGCVGQDEIIVLLTLKDENDDQIPKEVLLQFHYIYLEAARGNTVNELGYWCVKESTFLDSKQHGGFLFIRPTFQCLNRIEVPPPPFLVGILIHKSEIPWARVFPLRLMLRLGAEFRYYPCPLVSIRDREPVYYEIGHTIINLLADFRNLSYTIPSVRGLKIHMEANQTTILIPRNRYDQVVRALNNSNDPVLALAGNFSADADAHLVCMQSKGNEITYSTHAININDKPRKVTGASFVVLNGALKTTSGVEAKSSIVEDGLMVQVPSETMAALRTKLRNMENWSVQCGPIEGRNAEEVVKVIWCEDDKNFNVGVKSVIDNMALDGVPSIRVHSGKDYVSSSKFIRWTQVFIIKCEDGATSAKIGDPLEVNKLSESIARATCLALTKLLELLSASGLNVLAVRATIDQENVGYEAGSNGEKLAPIYMNSLDNELIPVLHKAASTNDSVAVLELVFHVMDH